MSHDSNDIVMDRISNFLSSAIEKYPAVVNVDLVKSVHEWASTNIQWLVDEGLAVYYLLIADTAIRLRSIGEITEIALKTLLTASTERVWHAFESEYYEYIVLCDIDGGGYYAG